MKKLLFITLLLLSSLSLNAQRCIVLDFQIGTNVTEEDVESISYEFRSTFNPTCYRVIDHERVMKKVTELGFNPGKMTAENIRKVGRNMDAVIVVYGILDKYMGEYSLDVSVMDVSSGTTALNQNTTFQQSEYRTHPRFVSKTMSSKMCELISNSNNVVSSKNQINSSTNYYQSNDVQTITIGNVSFDMIKVVAGSFIMGCTSEQEPDCNKNELNKNSVTISQNFYIGKFEVTQELYEAVMGVNPSKRKFSNRPVEQVSWYDAINFCSELSRLTGRNFTLPTEAEWEYAARGGEKTTKAKYSGSASVTIVAWYEKNSKKQTNQVGQLRANELGIYDMSGNVWEWCLDWYGKYSGTAQTDPVGPESGSYRIIRGGSWNNDASHCRVSFRDSYSPGFIRDDLGFRVVLH